mmetsp:Transcript_24813/g.78124  ORF Transcript_24813/g.78124 Transcript_24813/m.78124 type:complete len:148 (+) Transcript_24813:1249-1692(+)
MVSGVAAAGSLGTSGVPAVRQGLAATRALPSCALVTCAALVASGTATATGKLPPRMTAALATATATGTAARRSADSCRNLAPPPQVPGPMALWPVPTGIAAGTRLLQGNAMGTTCAGRVAPGAQVDVVLAIETMRRGDNCTCEAVWE